MSANSGILPCSSNYWSEHLRPPPSSEPRAAPTSSPIVAGRRCPCPWLRRSSHVQHSASSPTAAAAYLDKYLRPPPARCFYSAPMSSPMASVNPYTQLALPNLALCSTRRARPWSPQPISTRSQKVGFAASLAAAICARRGR